MNFNKSITAKIGVYDIPGLAEIENSGQGDGQCWMKRSVGNIFNVVIEQVLKRGMNCSLIGFKEIGTYDQEKGRYTQLIGAVQNGDIDMSLLPVYYPLKDDTGIFHYTPTVKEDEMTLLTMYNVTHSSHISDILFMYSSIPVVIWLCFLLSFFISATIIKIGQKMLKPKKQISAIYSTLAAFLDMDDYSFTFNDLITPRFIMFLSLSVSIFTFFFVNLINNTVGAEMVTIDKAYAVTSYKDIVERNVTGYFNKAMPEYEKFRDSPADSYERKIYENGISFELGPQTLIRAERPLMNQETAIIARREITEAVSLAIIVMFGSKYPDARAFVNEDKQAKKYTNVFVVNKNADPYVKDATDRIISLTYEHGIMAFLFSKLPEGIAGDLTQPVTPSIHRKLTAKVEEDEPILLHVQLINTIHFFQCLISLTLFAVLVIIFEYFKSRYDEKYVKKLFIEYKRPSRVVMLKNIRNEGRNVRNRRRFYDEDYQTPLRRYLNSYQRSNQSQPSTGGLIINRLEGSSIDYKRPSRVVMLENIRIQGRNVRNRRRFYDDNYQTPLRRYLNSYQHANGVRRPTDGIAINNIDYIKTFHSERRSRKVGILKIEHPLP